MRQLFDFECADCGDAIEKLVDTNIRMIDCHCGGRANRIMSMPTVKLDGTDPSFPGAYDKWARVREERHRVSAKKSYARG